MDERYPVLSAGLKFGNVRDRTIPPAWGSVEMPKVFTSETAVDEGRSDRPERRLPLCAAVAVVGLIAATTTTHAAPPLPSFPIPAQAHRPADVTADLPAAVVTKVAVFGVDSRTRLPKSMDKLRSSIGVIYNERTRTVCTAFCAADNVIATASHCVFRTKGEAPPPAERFIFARPKTKHANVRFAGAAAKAASQQIVAGTIGISTKPPIEAARDWALIRIDSKACAGRVLPIKALTPDEIGKEADAGRVYQAAFHRDYGAWTMAYSGACAAGRQVEGSGGPPPERDFVDTLNVVLHTCDTGGASSGSPILVDTPTGPQVVAINVGTFVRSRVVLEEGVVVKRSPAKPVANTAVSAVAFASHVEPFSRSTVLTGAADLKELQRRLTALALMPGPIDGRFDQRTRSAIEQWQIGAGLPRTGLPTRELLQALSLDAPSAPAPAKPR